MNENTKQSAERPQKCGFSKIYKLVTVSYTHLYEEIVSALSDINAFNAGKKRDKALDLLSAWLPDVEKFSKEIGKQQALSLIHICGYEYFRKDSVHWYSQRSGEQYFPDR